MWYNWLALGVVGWGELIEGLEGAPLSIVYSSPPSHLPHFFTMRHKRSWRGGDACIQARARVKLLHVFVCVCFPLWERLSH